MTGFLQQLMLFLCFSPPGSPLPLPHGEAKRLASGTDLTDE
ncbi:MAG: hypothetical protein OSB05_00310 [Akkermansiaceae bacterium]|nr:hypothetical protein [Akkermansiaceae bacterium]